MRKARVEKRRKNRHREKRRRNDEEAGQRYFTTFDLDTKAGPYRYRMPLHLFTHSFMYIL
jgi:hypothetical protein